MKTNPRTAIAVGLIVAAGGITIFAFNDGANRDAGASGLLPEGQDGGFSITGTPESAVWGEGFEPGCYDSAGNYYKPGREAPYSHSFCISASTKESQPSSLWNVPGVGEVNLPNP